MSAFITGREFSVQSDHKPMEALVKREIDDVIMRLQQMFIQLLKCPGMSITYTYGNWRTASRMPLYPTDAECENLAITIHIVSRRVCLSQKNYDMYIEDVHQRGWRASENRRICGRGLVTLSLVR